MSSDEREHPVAVLTSSDGESVALHDFGGDGPALLLAHGNGLNAGMWVAAVPYLAERFHCWGIDLRGHGRAHRRTPDYSVERARFGEDVLTCVDEVGGPVCYAGHSLGGASGIYAAFVRPEAFRGLWLFEPVLIPESMTRPDGPSILIEASRRRRMEFDSVEDAIERFGSKPPFAGCDPAAVRAYVEIGTRPVAGGVRLSCEGEDEARVFGSGVPLDFGLLGGLTMPAVVAAGADGDEAHAIPARVAPLVAEALAEGRLESHPELSHFGPMEDPAAIAASIIAFYEPILAGTGS